ncbi:MAG: DUF3106 domain-containing protein [Luteimonas sp.]
MKPASRWILCTLLLATSSVLASDQDKPATPATATLPAWEQLSPAQREMLLTPLRERWDANPGDRAGMYEHARRWNAMTPAQRDNARRGVRHWEHMDPARRTEMRALFEKMKSMTPEQRKALREQWHAMSAEQRRAWVQANPPGQR